MKNQIQTVMRIAKQLGKELQNRFGEQDINYWSEDTGVNVTYLSRSDWQQHSRRRQSVYL